MNYQTMISMMSNICLESHNNVIIVGANASGKSDIIRYIYTKMNEDDIEKERFYFIDTVNKKFSIKSVSLGEVGVLPTVSEVVLGRFASDNFNLRDSFANLISAERALQEEMIFEEFEKLSSDFFGEKVELRRLQADEETVMVAEGNNTLRIGDDFYVSEKEPDGTRLSDGQQSILRLMLELTYFKNKSIASGNTVIKKTVLIDELDTYLDRYNSRRILDFISSKFRDFKYIVTTHSSDVLYGARNATVVAINRKNRYLYGFNIYSSDDIDSMTSAEGIMQKTVPDAYDAEIKNTIESDLEMLFNHALSTKLNEEEVKRLKAYTEMDLSPICKLYIDSIARLIDSEEYKRHTNE